MGEFNLVSENFKAELFSDWSHKFSLSPWLSVAQPTVSKVALHVLTILAATWAFLVLLLGKVKYPS